MRRRRGGIIHKGLHSSAFPSSSLRWHAGLLSHDGEAIAKRKHERDLLLAPERRTDESGLSMPLRQQAWLTRWARVDIVLEYRDSQGRLMSAKEVCFAFTLLNVNIMSC